MVDIEVDSDFNIHTSYHSDFFLLRTKVLVNGENATITSAKEGVYEEPVLNFRHGGSTISTKLWSLTNALSPILVQYGVYHVNTFYYERSPLFHLVFSSESCLRLFLVKIPKVRSAMQSELQSVLMKTSHVDQTESYPFTVKVQPELFLVSPNLQKAKGVELQIVTTENCSNFVTRWKNSKLFDFGALYQEEGSSSSTTVTTSVPASTKEKSISTQKPPVPKKPTDWRKKRQGQREFMGREAAAEVSKPPQITTQPTSLEEITTGKPVTFSIQATGTEPMNYQWQCWKPEGEEESEDWQDITCDGVKFQEMKAGLKLTVVQACDAGYYRCVVSNSAGSETSQWANLVVVAKLADLVNELKRVNDWIPLGLNLGVEISTLEAIERERITIGERRTQMLNEWQKQATPTWSAVIEALVKMGMRSLAIHLAQKQGISVPKPTKDEALEQLQNLSQHEEPTRSKLLAEVQNLIEDISKMDDQLKDSNKQLKDSQNSKQNIDDSINQLLNSFPNLREKIQSIADERNSIKKELESKQRECQLLTEMRDMIKEKDSAYNKLLEEKISKKRKKIKKLKEELERKESELQAAQQKARVQQKELSDLRAQLKKKYEEIKNLQSEKETIVSSCNTARQEVSKLVQLTFTLSSDKGKMEQQLTDIKEESELKSQQIEACNANISRLNKEVKALSHSLQAKQATVSQLERKLQSHQQAAITPEQLLELLKLAPQTAELEHRLQEAEYQKQQAELEIEMAIKEMETQKLKLQMELHAKLGKWLRGSTPGAAADPTNGAIKSASDKPKRHPLSELTWRRLPDMPRVMVDPQSVTVDTVVYIAQRVSDSVILRYDLHSQQWMEPLHYQYWWCGMTTVSSQLVMVGGKNVSTHKTTNGVGVYSPSQRSWTHPYPPLKTPRYWPAVSTYHQRLVVAGGCDISNTTLDSVEILDISVSHCQWLSATGLPVTCHLMSAAITHSTLYLLGGSLDKKVLSVPLSALTETDKPPTQWRTLPNAPLGNSTAIAVHGSLLTVGGSHGRQRSSAIHVYDQEKNKWNKMDNLPTEREDCACCLLSSGEILVAGGVDRSGWTRRMDVAAVKH